MNTKFVTTDTAGPAGHLDRTGNPATTKGARGAPLPEIMAASEAASRIHRTHPGIISAAGRLQKVVQDNGNIWQKVQNLDADAARQVAVRIVRFAQAHQTPVMVSAALSAAKRN